MTEQAQQDRRSRYGKELLYNPILQEVRDSGGSATTSEIESGVIERMRIDDDALNETNPAGQSYFRVGLNWARTELGLSGYLENISRGVWALTAEASTIGTVDPQEVRRRYQNAVRQKQRGRGEAPSDLQPPPGDTDDAPDLEKPEDASWRDGLLQLLQSMEPGQFERLCQRVLRSSGFTEVNVSGKSGDGGIDGNGILQIQGIISVPVAFQCKRYRGSVGSPVVREFRGSLGRQAERGLLMTTGTFTPNARDEATREGAVFIDLMDGDALLDKLKELQLGVRVELVEQTTVDLIWWGSNYGVSLQNGSDEGDE